MPALPATTPVGVIGTGTMGGGIAQVAATAGHPVLLYDTDATAIEHALERIGTALDRAVERGRMEATEADAVLERITPVDTLDAFAPAGLVIEAVAEVLETKRALFGALEEIVGPDAILATNTSSLSVTAMAAGLRQPGRVVGMHFFNPAPVMALVEVMAGLDTDRGVAETVFETAAAWGKSPVHTRSTPGFIVNRVARPFYAEGLRLLEEGAADVATIDAVMREAGGFRMGPFQLLDLVGIDVNWTVTNLVFDAFYADPRFKPMRRQQEMVEAGRLGRKSGRGFYEYGADAEPPQPATAPAGTPPGRVRIEGTLGVAQPLVGLIEQAGLAPARDAGPGQIRVGETTLALSDGRTATERAAVGAPRDLVLFDLCLDYAAAERVAIAPADQAGPGAVSAAAGLFQALGKAVSVIDDAPGLVVMRTVAMLANTAADAVHAGIADADAVDTAMVKGVNYPRGPLGWADAIGLEAVIAVLDNLARGYGEDRYRASVLLRRRAWAGRPLHG